MITASSSVRYFGIPRLLILAVFLLVPAASRAAGEGALPEAREWKNPHLALDCRDCHARIPEKGKSTPAEVIAGLKAEPVAVCRDCHEASVTSHHPVVQKTERKLPEGLPLGPGGEVICSTCHDVHLKVRVTVLLRGFDTGRYSVRMDMCLDCHAENFYALNPHRVEKASERCYTCHPARPGASDNGGKVVLQENLAQVCNFCHNVREKAHPRNVDVLKKIPESLPRDRGGQLMCGTCHDPHGTSGTLHFLRKPYVEHTEGGRYANPHGQKDYGSCLGCHAGVSPREEEMKKNLRYGGDDLLICHSCHGAMDACHPILVRLPPGMKPGKDLPLTADGKIKCLTCHDPTPAGGSGQAVRGRGPGEAVNTMCFRCHDREELVGRNPHLSMDDKTSCRFCHDTMTDPTNEEASRVSFISNTRLICLRCHPQTLHPMGRDHMVAPSGKVTVPEAFRLDGKGKITCTTCHNPHIEAKAEEGKGRRRRFSVDVESRSLCSLCHKR